MNFIGKGREYRYKLVENSYVVWLKTLNRYLQLEEPAFWIFKQMADGHFSADIVSGCMDRYRLEKPEATRFVSEIDDMFRQLYDGHQKADAPSLLKGSLPQTFESYAERHIRISGKIIRFTFGDSVLEQYIFRLLDHLECPPDSLSNGCHLEVFRFEEQVALRVNREIEFAWPIEEVFKLKGEVFLQILNIIHDAGREDWMGVIHASAVAHGNQALLFPAQPGSGKSTIASLLMAHNCPLVSDDFAPVSLKNSRVYTFPASISVKPGSLPLLSSYFPELKSDPETRISKSVESLRYLKPQHPDIQQKDGYPVRAIVFVQYNPHKECELSKISNLTAINGFLGESWLAANSRTAEQFLEWFFSTPCFTLHYGNHLKAIDTLLNLFEDVP
jgi:hypothetical protein